MQGRLVDQEIKSRIQSFPEKNWKKEIKIANKLGFSIIEWTIDYKKFFLNPINSLQNEKELNRILKKYKINISSITCDFFMQKPFYKFKNLESKQYNKLKHLIARCGKFNIKFLVIPLVDNATMRNIKNVKKKVVSFFLNFKKQLKKNNVKILFETDLTPKNKLKFIKSFDKNFGINYDTGNSKKNNFSLEEEKIYFDRVLNIHLKDCDQSGKSVKLGYGKVDFKRLFKLLKKKNYRGSIILQTARSKTQRHIEEILYNINYIKKC